MESSIWIVNDDQGMRAEVLPAFGGRVRKILISGRDILSFDESKMPEAPVSAGGIPVLFPLAGATKQGQYMIDGKPYSMRKHGFIYDKAFSVDQKSENAVTLSYVADDGILDQSYPYPHVFKVTYTWERNTFKIIAHIENRAQAAMPHAIGWHPYFKASDRKQLRLEHYMSIHYDYNTEEDLPASGEVDMNEDLDNVFCQPLKREFVLTNSAEGYRVRCLFDEAYRSIVIYNGKPGSVCIEPWCAVPDAINNGRMLQWIPPGESKEYIVKFEITTI